jgi:Ca2+-binding RTX toxin-like protein
MLVVAILAAVAALASPGQENLAHAAIVCTGHARQFGNGVVGTLGNDLIDCSASTVGVNIIGLDGDDFLIGGRGKDYIDAGAGDDWIFSREGDDILIGGDGKDGLFAGPGNDWLRGGDQNDTLFGDNGDDMLFGVRAMTPSSALTAKIYAMGRKEKGLGQFYLRANSARALARGCRP